MSTHQADLVLVVGSNNSSTRPVGRSLAQPEHAELSDRQLDAINPEWLKNFLRLPSPLGFCPEVLVEDVIAYLKAKASAAWKK